MPVNFNETQLNAIKDAKKTILKKEEAVLINNDRIKGFGKAKKDIDKFIEKKNPLVKEYIKLHIEAEKKPYTYIGHMLKNMKEVAAMQEVYKKAAAMCKNSDDKANLMLACTELDHHPAMVAYEKYIKGLEYLAGMKEEPEKEVVEFFKQELRVNLPMNKADIFELYRGNIDSWEVEDYEKEDYLNLDEHSRKLNDLYQKKVAPAKAREMFAKNQCNVYNLNAQFFGELNVDNMPWVYGYRNRMSPSAFCVGRMLAKKYPLEKIMDPKELVAEKKEIAKEYLEHREKKDLAWVTEKMYENSKYMMEAVKKYAKDHKAELKTEQDLVMHANTMGLLAYLCFDNTQEFQKIKESSNKEEYFKNVSEEEVERIGFECAKYMYVPGIASTDPIIYNLYQLKSHLIPKKITTQLYIESMLDEIQKDDSNFDSHLITTEEWMNINIQVGSIDEFNTMFDGFDVNIDSLEEKDVEVIASMMSSEFVKDNNLRYDSPRVPVTATKTPEKFAVGEIVAGEKLEKVVSRDDKQLIETDVPARMDQYLRDLEKKNIRGKASRNSKEFNDMMKAYDNALAKLGNAKAANKECLPELARLKEEAMKYIDAKRAQKGYEKTGTLDPETDGKMLGKVEGASIFTSSGKERYKLAIKMILRANELEKEIHKYDGPQMMFTGDIQTSFVEEEYNVNELPKEEPKQTIENTKVEPPKVEPPKVEVTYDAKTISKAKELLTGMEEYSEELEVRLINSMNVVSQDDNSLVPVDFLVNELNLGTEEQVYNMQLIDVMKKLTIITSQEISKENKIEEPEDEFALTN